MKKTILLSLSILMLCISGAQAQQKPLEPARVESSTGKENSILISASGVEQDPVTVQGRWNGEDTCLAEVQCFVSSWIEANLSGNMEHLITLRALSERTNFEQMIARNPNAMANNKERFKSIKKWGIIGWVQYGTVRVVMLVREEEQSQTRSYTLPLTQVNGRWAQTDALGNDRGVYSILDRIADAVMERHRPKTPQSR